MKLILLDKICFNSGQNYDNLMPAQIIVLLDHEKIFNWLYVNEKISGLADDHLGLMPRKTKHQHQVSKISRKKGRYIFQEQVIIEETITGKLETVEENVKNDMIEKWIKGEVVEDLTEGKAIENWTEENLKEFEEVGKRLITETLHWHDGAADSNIRDVYIGNSRTKMWRKKKDKNKLNDD